MAHRTDDVFAYAAEQDGKVTEVTDELITVEYKDGSTKTIELGSRFGHADGGVVPHTVTTSLKVGSKVKEGDVVAYNEWFFEPDPLDPSQALLKFGTLMNIAFWESPGTLEDSSEVSSEAASKLVSKTTKLRQIVVDFSQSLHQAVKEGDSVEYDSPLCLIEDSVTAANQLFDEKTLVTLTSLSTNAPKAKLEGAIDRIEVFYNGDLEEMSESLKAMAKKSNKRLKAQNSRKGSKVVDGRVGNNMRIDNQPLGDKRAVVNIYITGNEPYGIADKIVVSSQLKSTTRLVHDVPLVTESGRPVDVTFGARSMDNRIVDSAVEMGLAIRLLEHHTQKVIEAYDS